MRPAVEGAVVGRVLARGDTPLGSVVGPNPVGGGHVVAVPTGQLEEWWTASPASHDEGFMRERAARGEFETTADAIVQAGGARAPVDDEGHFEIGVPDGEALLCPASGGPAESLFVGVCHELMMDGQARVILWVGENRTMEIL